MTFLSSLSITKRLYGAIALMSVVFLAAGAVATHELDGVVDKAKSTADRRVPQLTQMAELELNVTRVSLQLRHAMLARNPEELAATLADVGAKRKLIDEILSTYEKSLFTQAGRDGFASIPPAVENRAGPGCLNTQRPEISGLAAV